MIQKPYLLAEIPHNLTGLPGSILAADVLAVTGSKKRKRSELALAIDGQGIKIYDVQSSKLTTSYVISPQAIFTCPPCSIRSRRLGNDPPRRHTYCSVTSPTPQIVCFSELSKAEITTTSAILGKDAAPVAYLDTFETGSGNKLVALHQDGVVIGYSEDLKTEEWRSSINTDAANLGSLPAVQAAATLSVQKARETVLRGREDVLATLVPNEDAAHRSLLLVMTRPPTRNTKNSTGALELRIFHINVANSDKDGFFLSTGEKLQPLATLAIPEPSDFVSKTAQITMHTASGTVYQNTEDALAVYDLTGSVPRLVHTLVRNDNSSYLRVSPKLVASSRGNCLSIIDLTYGSFQDEGVLTLDHEVKVDQKSKDFKLKETMTLNTRLLSYFAPLGIMVALDGRRLLAVQLFTAQKVGGSRKRKQEGLLVDSIGRGSSSMTKARPTPGVSNREIETLGTYLPSSEIDKWKAQKTALDRCVAKNDGKEFEGLMAAALGVKALEEDKKMSDTGSRSRVNRHAVSYALNAIFSVDQAYPDADADADPADDGPRSLNIRFFPDTICNWLIDRGLLTSSQIELSLKQNGALPITSELATGSLIRALANLDSKLHVLLSVLASPVPLSSQELVHVLAIVMQVSNTEATEPQRLLTIGDAGDSGSVDNSQLVNRQNTDSIPSPLSNRPADGLIRRLLNSAMERLYACPSSSVVRALKTELPTPQLRLVVDSLRMEIARSGWLSPYEDNLECVNSDLRNNSHMCFIAHLLNCVIDSLGTGGWLSGNSMFDDLTETADTIAYMKAEISAALEGIEEATYLKGMLGEMLLCSKDSLNPSVKNFRSNEAALPAKPETIALDEEGSQLLPLGLKQAEIVSRTKVGAGGELMKRSKRDIGRLKSRMVGKYNFDRIVI